VLQSCEAPDRAQPGTHPPRDARALGWRDLVARNGRQNGGRHLPESSTARNDDTSIPRRFADSMEAGGGGNSCAARGRNR